jgi:uncharacterized protein (DUF2141 family)
MGNFLTKIDNPPQKGQICTIINTHYTQEQGYPKNVFGQGSKVKVLGSKNLLCSRPNAHPVTISIIQLPNGTYDVYPSSNLA